MRREILLAALLLGTSGLVAGCDQLKKVAGGKDVVVKETEFPERVLWGDTHLHTANSVDAFGFGVRLGPEEALRFARGEEVTSTTGLKAKLPRPKLRLASVITLGPGWSVARQRWPGK